MQPGDERAPAPAAPRHDTQGGPPRLPGARIVPRALRGHLRRQVLAVLSRSAPAPDYDAPVGDVGLFGPDSVTWKIHADFPSMMVGGLAALMLNLLPLGRVLWMPDFLAVVLVFWNIHQPRRIGLGVAFVFGLLLDVHQASLLGQHALAYTVLIYCAIMIHRRILWFSVPGQALQLLPLFALTHAITIVLRLIGGAVFPGWPVLLSPVLEAALWPIVSVLLLAPQRRAPNPDANRPL